MSREVRDRGTGMRLTERIRKLCNVVALVPSASDQACRGVLHTLETPE